MKSKTLTSKVKLLLAMMKSISCVVLSLEELIKYHKKLLTCLYKNNCDIGSICSMIACRYASEGMIALQFTEQRMLIIGEFSKASYYCQRSCDVLEFIFGSYSIELTQELPNLVETLLLR